MRRLIVRHLPLIFRQKINHFPYTPDLTADRFDFGQLHLALKGQRYIDIKTIQKNRPIWTTFQQNGLKILSTIHKETILNKKIIFDNINVLFLKKFSLN